MLNMMDDQDDGSSSQRRGPQNKLGKTPLPRYRRSPFSYLVVAIAIITLMMMVHPWEKVESISWSEFTDCVSKNQIKTIDVKDTTIDGEFNEQGLTARREQKGQDVSSKFTVDYNPDWVGEQYRKELESKGLDAMLSEQLSADRTHPHLARRVMHLINWVRYGNYLDIISGDYPRRPARPGARDEAASSAALSSA